MTTNKKKRKKIIIGFAEKDPRDQRLWRQMMADKEEDTVNMSGLIKGLLASYYDYREANGTIELPSLAELAKIGGQTLPKSKSRMSTEIATNDSLAMSLLDSEYDD